MMKHLSTRRLSSFLCVCALPLGLLAGPVASVTERSVDLGQVRADQTATHQFVVANVGDEDLLLLRTRSTCGNCIQVELAVQAVKPGEKAELSATLRFDGLDGTITRVFYLETNDPASGTIQFTLGADVQPVFRIEPESATHLGRIEPGTPVRKTFSLSLPGVDSFAVTSVTCPEGITLKQETGSRLAAHRFVLIAQPTPGPSPFMRESIVIDTDALEAGTISVPLYAYVVAPVSALPEQVVFSLPADADGNPVMPEGSPPRGRVLLKRIPPAAFNVTVLGTDVDTFAATLIEGDGRGSKYILIELKEAAAYGPVGEVVVSTDVPGAEKVRIPVAVAVRQLDAAAQHRRPVTFEMVLEAVRITFGTPPELTRQAAGREEPTDVVAWAATRLCSRDLRIEQIADQMGGVTIARLGRSTDQVTRRMREDPAFAAKCHAVLSAVEEARSEDAQ